MDAGGLAQMSQTPFPQPNGLAMPSGLASRRGGQNPKPLSFDTFKASQAQGDNGAPTPRTSRSHLLAGLRTAPKSASASSFPNNPMSPTTSGPQVRNGNSAASSAYGGNNLYSGPKTSIPRYGTSHQQQPYNQAMGFGAQYTTEQILAPPQLQFDDVSQEQMDPNVQAQLMVTNAMLAEQQQRLTQQLTSLHALASQFQGMNVNGQPQMTQQQYQALYQQQQLQAMQQALAGHGMAGIAQPNIYTVYDPVTGQQALYMDQNQAQLINQAQLAQAQAQYTNYQVMQIQQQAAMNTPRVQVSPPPSENARPSFRTNSPPRRHELPMIENPAPLPPPSANAFRRGHKKSLSSVNSKNGLSIGTEEPRKSAGPKTAQFPLTPQTANGYGPGHQRAGEHPVRQPRNPPSMDELKAKPTAKHEGSKNFASRTRRSAINNLVRAGLERRKEARSSGSISPISESTEGLIDTPLADNDSDSGRSGSGSLVDQDDAECSLPSSRTSTGSWGAIGSDRPSSRQKAARNSVDSTASLDDEVASAPGSFASLLKSVAAGQKSADTGPRKAPMLVFTSADKRKGEA